MVRYIPWLFIGVILLSGLLPASICTHLEFNAELIKQGEFWRLLTGQIVHFGFNHSLMNALGLAIVQYSFLDDMPVRGWLMVQIAVLSAVAGGLLFFNPDISVYRGYSGAFIGVLCFSLLHFWSRAPRVALIFFGGLTAKIVMEHLPNYDVHYLQSLIGVAVAVDAHLYGFIMGILAQLVFFIWCRFKIKPAADAVQ